MKEPVRKTLQQFQDGYTTRDMEKIDNFMQLFMQNEETEMLGIGAAFRGGFEWFQGTTAIREIIESDWTHWGAVVFDVAGAKITIHNDVAWLSTAGTLEQTDTFETALPFYLKQMQELLEDEKQSPAGKMMEATHYGMRRLRERQLGVGHKWNLVLTAVLIKTNRGWQFHTLHWSMPVD